MNGKVRLGPSVLMILGIIYAVLGAIFLVVGKIVYRAVLEQGRIVGGIFAGIGSIFFILGVIFLILEGRKRRQIYRLLETGQYIEGEITDYKVNFNVTINNRHPYIVIARYLDPYGATHIFKSRNIYQYLEPSIIGRTVKIYVEDDTYSPYYVDMSEILSQYVEH